MLGHLILTIHSSNSSVGSVEKFFHCRVLWATDFVKTSISTPCTTSTLETYHTWPHIRLTESALKAHQLRRLLQIWRSLMTSCTTAVPTLSGWHLRLKWEAVEVHPSRHGESMFAAVNEIAKNFGKCRFERFHPVHLCVLDIQPLKVEAHFTFMGWMVAYIARRKAAICPDRLEGIWGLLNFCVVSCRRDRAQPFQWARSFSFPFQIVKHEVDED